MIDPGQHEKQIRIVRNGATEYQCPGCNRRTRDKTGRCIYCQRTAVPRIERLDDAQLTVLLERCRTELRRRHDAITKALEGP